MMAANLRRSLLLIVLAATLLFPTLLPQHRYPQTVFYHEWSAALGVVALWAIAACAERPHWRVSGAIGAILLLMSGMALNVLTGPLPAVALAQFWMATLLLGMAWVCTEGVREFGAGTVTQVAAGAILVSAVGQTFISVAQLAGWNWFGLVMPKLLLSTYGNVAQPNHYGNLLWLGMVSGLYLWLRGRLPTWLAVVLAIDLSFFSALSASRAVLLYTLGLPVLTLICWRHELREDRSKVLWAVTLIFFLSCAAQAWVAFGGAGQLLGVASSIGRLDDAGSNTQRLFDWAVALKTAQAYPLGGSGIGTFAWQTGLHSIGLPPARFVRIGENAHDTLLHFAAELGPLLTLVVLFFVLVWLYRRVAMRTSNESFWALGLLLVLGAHSLVEYPLWYAYFLVPAGLAIGVLDAQDDTLPTFRISRWPVVMVVVMGVALLGWNWHDYRVLEKGYAMLNAGQEPPLPSERAQIDTLADSVARYSMFASHAGVLKLRAWDPADEAAAAQMAGLCDTAARAKPSYTVLEKCVSAYAWQRRKIQALQMVELICGAYPLSMRRNLPDEVRRAWRGKGWEMPAVPGCVSDSAGG